MNTKQLATAQRLTIRLGQLIDNVTFTVTMLDEIDSKTFMISACNSGAPWYVEPQMFIAFIGPKGGVKICEGSSYLRNMI